MQLEYASRSTNKVANILAKINRTNVIANYDLVSFELPPGFDMDVILKDQPS